MPAMSTGRPARSGLNRSMRRSSSGQHAVPRRLDEEQPLQLAQLLRDLGGEVVGLGPVVRGRRAPTRRRRRAGQRLDHPRGAVPGHGGPALVVDAAVDEALEVLQVVASRGRPRRRSVGTMLVPCSGICWTPLTDVGTGSPAASRTVGDDVDDVGELVAARPGAAIRAASARPCRCGCRPSGRRPAWSTGTACWSRAPSRPRSGCRPSACRARRSSSAGTPASRGARRC